MVDNVAITAGAGTSIAADDISSVYYQRVKISQGADGSAADTSTALPLPIRPIPKFVTVDFTAETTAVDLGDVVADTQIVATCTPGNDIPGILQSITLIDVDDQKAKLRIVLLDANASLGTEDSAPNIDDSNVQSVIGTIDINVSDYVDLGGASVVHKSGLGIIVKPATNNDDIYAAIYTPDTSTPTYAGGHIYVRFGFTC